MQNTCAALDFAERYPQYEFLIRLTESFYYCLLTGLDPNSWFWKWDDKSIQKGKEQIA